MRDLMTPETFITVMLGKPWKRYACGMDACDCYGLLIMYYRLVLSIELGEVPPVDIAQGFAERQNQWSQVNIPSHGIMVMMYDDSKREQHCGIILPDLRVIHCQGSESQPGNVRISRIQSLQKIYNEVRFYAYNPQY